MKTADYNICKPLMCNCPGRIGEVKHYCTDPETASFKKPSNFDGLHPEVIEEIGRFLLHPEYGEWVKIINGYENKQTFPPGAPKVPSALAAFEEQSTYVRTALNPLTAPIRKEADLYRRNLFKEQMIDKLNIFVAFAIGMALEAPLALTAAKTASLFNGTQTVAAIGMGIGGRLGAHLGLQQHSLKDWVIRPILIGTAVATLGGENLIAAIITASVAVTSGILTGSVIKSGVNKIFPRYLNLYIYIPSTQYSRSFYPPLSPALPMGIKLAAYAVAAYVFYNNPFGENTTS